MIMKKNKRRAFARLLTWLVLLFSCLFSSCVFDVDKAVNIGKSVEKKIVVQEDCTIFYFYYNDQERPIEDYQIIKARIEYYVDYHTSMKKKDFFINVPDDVQYENGKAYFTAKIGDVLTNQSVVASISVHGNYKVSKSENASRVWEYVIASVVAVVLLIVFCGVYTAVCDACYSNSVQASLVWLGSIILYVVATLVIGAFWGTGPAGILIGSGVLFFILTLFPFFKYKL